MNERDATTDHHIRSALRRAPALWLGALVLTAAPIEAVAQQDPAFTVKLEAGPVWQSRNDVQIPNDPSGTRFSLLDVAGTGPWPSARVYVTWNIDRRNSLRFLAAPLSYTMTGVVQDSVGFAGSTYLSGQPLEATYQFNSWRVGYRYRVTDRERLRLWVGVTAKIRDAKIELRQGATTSRDADVGFVPLLHFAADWQLHPRWHGLFDVEGLAGGPGRAFDVSLQVRHNLSGRWDVGGGYRTVEGGADVDAVFNFAWFHTLVLSAAYRF